MAALTHYYVNDTESTEGDHEVHRSDCYWLGLANSKTYLGLFDSCAPAVAKAKRDHYRNSNGCVHCSPNCHTG